MALLFALNEGGYSSGHCSGLSPDSLFMQRGGHRSLHHQNAGKIRRCFIIPMPYPHIDSRLRSAPVRRQVFDLEILVGQIVFLIRLHDIQCESNLIQIRCPAIRCETKLIYSRLHAIRSESNLFHTRCRAIRSKTKLIRFRLHAIRSKSNLFHVRCPAIQVETKLIHVRLHAIRSKSNLFHVRFPAIRCKTKLICFRLRDIRSKSEWLQCVSCA